jgi:hypothetical protein
MSSAAVAEVLATFGDAELIPLPELSDRIRDRWGVNLDPADRSRMISAGLITPAPGFGADGRKRVTRDGAADLIIGAMIAMALAISLLKVLRGAQALGIRPADFGAVLPTT